MTPRSIRRGAQRSAKMEERKANKLARKAAATVSQAQLTANRENAQLSTGPTTEAGKAISSLNAVKTGLTGQTVLLPSEDAARYRTHIQTFEAHFQPVGPEEQALVQSIADTGWRLSRIPNLEMAIYAQGRIEFAEEFAEQDESVRPALIEAQIYLTYEKQIRNLHLQEARLVRRREKETAELRRLQQERAAKEAREPAAKHTESTIGFDFSDHEIALGQYIPKVPASLASSGFSAR